MSTKIIRIKMKETHSVVDVDNEVARFYVEHHLIDVLSVMIVMSAYLREFQSSSTEMLLYDPLTATGLSPDQIRSRSTTQVTTEIVDSFELKVFVLMASAIVQVQNSDFHFTVLTCNEKVSELFSSVLQKNCNALIVFDCLENLLQCVNIDECVVADQDVLSWISQYLIDDLIKLCGWSRCLLNMEFFFLGQKDFADWIPIYNLLQVYFSLQCRTPLHCRDRNLIQNLIQPIIATSNPKITDEILSAGLACLVGLFLLDNRRFEIARKARTKLQKERRAHIIIRPSQSNPNMKMPSTFSDFHSPTCELKTDDDKEQKQQQQQNHKEEEKENYEQDAIDIMVKLGDVFW
jgi:hypothetical protein